MVSEEYPKEAYDLPVFHPTEIVPQPDMGVILAMSARSAEKAAAYLERLQFRNVMDGVYVD
jgi:hypothetical protein